MANALWYGLLSLVSMSIFIYTLWKARNKKIIALYTFLSGLIYFFEYFILVLFKGYEYKPNFLKNEYNDSIMGAIVSNAFTVPMISVFVGVFQLNWKKMIGISGIILLIEILFLHLGIYKHFWWKVFYTEIGLLVCVYHCKNDVHSTSGRFNPNCSFYHFVFY